MVPPRASRIRSSDLGSAHGAQGVPMYIPVIPDSCPWQEHESGDVRDRELLDGLSHSRR